MHNVLLLSAYGVHYGAWRLEECAPQGNVAFSHFRGMAEAAEVACFDAVLIADVPALQHTDLRPFDCLDPSTLLAAIAATTSSIGLIATLSTTYNEPYDLARRLASLDHISGGRAGWNIVTTDYPRVQANFGRMPELSHGDRYDRAAEFVGVCMQLWSSWGRGAILADKSAGLYADTSQIQAIEHEGSHFSVRGPLQVPTSPQQFPVLAQAGSSANGQALAASFADVVYVGHSSIDGGRRFYRSLKQQVAARGRHPDDVKVLVGLVPVVGSTRAAAHQYLELLDSLVDEEYSLTRLAGVLGVDRAHLLPERRLPEDLPMVSSEAPFQGRRRLILDHARQAGVTVAGLMSKINSGGAHLTVVGTPDDVADLMQEWVQEGAADGFVVMPPSVPTQLGMFMDLVVPLLQKRGVHPQAYESETLRQRLGVPVRA